MQEETSLCSKSYVLLLQLGQLVTLLWEPLNIRSTKGNVRYKYKIHTGKWRAASKHKCGACHGDCPVGTVCPKRGQKASETKAGRRCSDHTGIPCLNFSLKRQDHAVYSGFKLRTSCVRLSVRVTHVRHHNQPSSNFPEVLSAPYSNQSSGL